MKLSHLLTGAALAALTAGAANAEQVTRTGGSIGATNVFASEYDLAGNPLAGNLVLQFDASTADAGDPLFDGLSASDEVTITIAMTGDLTFDGQVVDTDFSSGGTCDFVVSAGGGDGSKSVAFTSTTNTAVCDDAATDIAFDLGLEVGGAGNFSLTVDGPSGQLFTETYDGVPTNLATTAPLVSRASGVEVVITPDTNATFADFASTSGFPFDNLNAGDVVLGTVNFNDETSVLSGVDFSTGFDLSTATITDALSITVTMESKTSFSGINFLGSVTGAGGSTVPFTTAGGNSVTATLALANLALADLADGENIEIRLVPATDNNGTPISFQTPTVSVSLTGEADYDLSGLATSGELQTITLENTNVAAPAGGAFQWVGDGGNVDSVFRCLVSGSSASSPRVFAILTNATNGNNGTFDLGNIGTSGGELIVTSDMIAAVSGPFSRADVNIAVTNPTTAGGCDRLMASPGGTLSDFSADYN